MRAPIDVNKATSLPRPLPKAAVPPTPADEAQKKRDLSWFSAKDTDGDGGLTEDEMYSKDDDWVVNLSNSGKFWAADKDHDGKLNPDEYLGARAAERERQSKMNLPGPGHGLGKLAPWTTEKTGGQLGESGTAFETLDGRASKIDD